MTTRHFQPGRIARLFIITACVALSAIAVFAQTSSFTYQGRFTDGGTAANGTYDMQFKLFDGSGNQIGSTTTNGAVIVRDGVFTVQLDYGAAAFPGDDRFLELGVRAAGSGDAYTVLSPRQQLASTPYAIRAASASQLNGVDATQFVQTNDSRLTDERTPVAGSGNYIQNTTSQQSANFNINGNGTATGMLSAGVVNTATQYNIAGQRFLSAPGNQNTFVGADTGVANTTGNFNVFVGAEAGSANTTGYLNSFFGAYAGHANTIGGSNSFFGYIAGLMNTTGSYNSIFGKESGYRNTTGSDNSFFGNFAGHDNTTGDFNSFFGGSAGQQTTTGKENAYFGFYAGGSNTSGSSNSMFGVNAGFNNTASSNSFFGYKSGFANTTATGNAFFGSQSGAANTTGNNNSFFGLQSGLTNSTGANNSFFGSQSGFSNSLGSNNSFFGSSAGFLNTTNGVATGGNNSFFGAFAGQNNSTAIDNSFFGNLAGKGNNTGDQNSFFGSRAGQANSTGYHNSFFGTDAGANNIDGIQNAFFGNRTGFANKGGFNNSFFGDGAGFQNTTGYENAFFGLQAGASNKTGAHNTLLGYNSDVASDGLTYATAIGADAVVSTSSTIVLGRSNGADTVRVPGSLSVALLGAGGSTSLCRNIINQISTCSSSLRYKKNIQPFNGGLSVLNRLRPITFDWKQGGMHDLGFGAEEIAAVEPLLVTHNDKGEVEGVKYDRISAVLVNAVKEQQEQIRRQQVQIESLKQLVCGRRRRASVCK